MRVLVLGGYGLIGAAIARRLLDRGHDVVGLGRSAALGQRLLPQIAWVGADIAALRRPEDWKTLLDGVDAVVNASGALQDGARDRLSAVQDVAIRALIAACEQGGAVRFVQISAPGAVADASTAFMRTKAIADAALRASALDWVIFKPGLVISPSSYGGTTLLRMLAAFPVVQPLVLGDRALQTVAVADVADAALRAVEGAAPSRRDYDLVEPRPHRLREVVAAFRAWLGFAPARAVWALPIWLGFALGRCADAAGWLGWRAPLRSTALRVLSEGVTGDPAPWRAVTGAPLLTLEQTFAAMPATAQERVFARMQLAFPALLLTLALFWIASGVIGLWRGETSALLLTPALPLAGAKGAVWAGAALDIAIGAGLLVRRWTRGAAWAALGLSAVYLLGSTLLAPALWADPLGPMLKVFPAMALALVVAALAEER